MYKACVVVLNDSEYKGEKEDSEGRILEKYLQNNDFEVLVYKIIPEIKDIYEKFIIRCCDNYCVDIVVTIGNKDLAEEVTKEIFEEENKELSSYRRKKTIIKNLQEDINESKAELESIVESIKKI